MMSRRTLPIPGIDRLVESILGLHQPETHLDPERIRAELPAEWTVVEEGNQPDVYDPQPDESGIRMVPPHLDAAVLIQPISVGGLFKRRVWRMALQTKVKYWETGDRYVFETQWQEWFDTRQELDDAFEALTTDLAAATEIGDLHVIEDDSHQTESPN